MVVTEAAKKLLKEKLSANTEETDVYIRLNIDSEDKLGLVLGRETEGDTVVEYEDEKLLLVGEELAKTLENALLDVKETVEGSKLVLSGIAKPDSGGS